MLKNEKLLRVLLAVFSLMTFCLGIIIEMFFPGNISLAGTREVIFYLLIFMVYVLMGKISEKFLRHFLVETLEKGGKAERNMKMSADVIMIILLICYSSGVTYQRIYPGLHSPALEGAIIFWIGQAAITFFLASYSTNIIERVIDREVVRKGDVFIELAKGKWKKIGRVQI